MELKDAFKEKGMEKLSVKFSKSLKLSEYAYVYTRVVGKKG